MYRILVCFHTTPNPDLLSEDEWIAGSRTGAVDTDYLKKELSAYDESALELSCRFADACGADVPCQLCAVTIADGGGDRFLQMLAAVGFAQTDRIAIPDETARVSLSSEQTAGLLYSYIKQQGPFDLILCGRCSSDGSMGKAPLLLAEALGMRCITQVTNVTPADGSGIKVIHDTDTGVRETIWHEAAVLVIGNAADTYLRVPTLRARMQHKGQRIGLYDSAALMPQERAAGAVLRFMEPVLQKRDAVRIDVSDPAEAARIMRSYFETWMNE